MLKIDLTGKHAFIAGVADDNGYGWAIAKALSQAGASIRVGTWPPVMSLFSRGLEKNKFDTALPDGENMEIVKVYPMDAMYDAIDDVPVEIQEDKRYRDLCRYTISDVAKAVQEDLAGAKLDILVHSLANGPEVKNPLLKTSRKGYLAAISSSAFSLVSMVQHFAPIMNEGGAVVSLTFLASERVVPGYGGGMSSAKAALESDTRMLAYEAGRKYKIRVNTISAGPLRSRAARAIGNIDKMAEIYSSTAPLEGPLEAREVANAAAFFCSPLASGIVGGTIHVDKGYHTMGLPGDYLSEASSQA